MQPSKLQITSTSGSSKKEVPTLLSYPKILDLDSIPEIKEQFVYICRAYPENGLAVLIKRSPEDDDVSLMIGDWDGNPIPLDSDEHLFHPAAIYFATEESVKFIELMKCVGLTQAIFYLSIEDDELVLTDIRTSLNKFAGPGMVRDLFSKIIKTQEVIKIEHLNDQVLQAIQNDQGSYQGDLIIKCSAFKTTERGNEMLPLYARVKR